MRAKPNQLAVFDIGNTNITFGVFKAGILNFKGRLQTDALLPAERYSELVGDALYKAKVDAQAIQTIVVASVVPALNNVFQSVSQTVFGAAPLCVGQEFSGGLALEVPFPETVGADRIANAVAAGELYSKPALVVDFGTATTFDVVGVDGSYQGGVIAPGPETSLLALVQRTAKLPVIEIGWPAEVLGKTTEAAMQSGLVLGYMELIDGLIARLEIELGSLGKIIATGGLGSMFAEHSRKISTYDADLTLQGLRIIGERMS